MNRSVSLSDIRGWSRLAVEATVGLTDVVEMVHRSVTRLPRAGGATLGRTRGITGLVYRTVRQIAQAVGGGIDGALAQLALIGESPSASAPPASSVQHEAAVAVLNGVLGDHLEASENSLAIPMQFRRGGRIVDAAREKGDRIVLLVHGLCRSDLQWRRRGHDHGCARGGSRIHSRLPALQQRSVGRRQRA